MKSGIHPKYFQATVTCAQCGNTFTVGSTRQDIRVDICSNCHPVFTGKQLNVEQTGQVERFQRRLERAARG